MNSNQSDFCVNFDPTLEILKRCPQMQSKGLESYVCNPERLMVSLIFEIMRFIMIDDVTETYQINSAITFYWNLDCLKSATKTNWPEEIKVIFPQNTDLFWLPDLIHFNSIDEVNFVKSSSMSKRIMLDLVRGQVIAYVFGVFKSYCDMDFRLFPFDKQICNFTIFKSGTGFDMKGKSIEIYPLVMPRNFGWKLNSHSLQNFTTTRAGFAAEYVSLIKETLF